MSDECWCHTVDNLLYYVGVVVILNYVSQIVLWVWRTFLAPKDRPLNEYIKGKKQPWALITGSTEGIGKEYAFQLARKGVSIVLCARNKEKLEDVATQIKNKYPQVEVKYVIADASSAQVADFDRIASEIQDLELTFLVNNVGISHLSQPLENMDVKESYDLININVRFPVLLTRAVLPIMKKHATANSRGAIINVSSLSGLGPTPYLTIYSSTKYFNRAFSTSLALELKRSNIDVQVTSPGFVRTAMTSKMRADFRHCSSEEIVIGALDQLPLEDVQPFWVHALQAAPLWYLPTWAAQYIVLYRMNDFKQRAQKALERKKQEKKDE